MKTKMTKKNFSFIILIAIGIMFSLNVSAQWINKSSNFHTPGLGIDEMIAVGNSVAWATAYDGTTFPPITEFTRTTDGGNHWTSGSISAYPDYYLVGIAPLSATLCYGSIANFDNGNCKIVKTTNGGTTWIEQFNFDYGAVFAFFADIYFFNANDGLIYGDPSDGYMTIFTTQDGGSHWTRVPEANLPATLPDEFSYVYSVEGLGNTFWTVSTSGRIWKTLDKGLHWNAYQTEETLIDYSNLKMRDALNGLWGVHDELYRTIDGGITWTDVELSGTWFTDNLAYVPGTVSTYVSTGGHNLAGYGALHGIGTSYSLDDGNTWITIDTAVEHNSIPMVNSYTGYTGGFNVSDISSGIYKYNGSALGYSCGNNQTSMCHKGHDICVDNGSIPNHLSKGDNLGTCSSRLAFDETTSDNLQLRLLSNPISPDQSGSATISFLLSQSQKVSLRIFDVNGRLVSTLAYKTFEAGENEIVWNAEEVNAGVYFLQMQTTGNVEMDKIIVTK